MIAVAEVNIGIIDFCNRAAGNAGRSAAGDAAGGGGIHRRVGSKSDPVEKRCSIRRTGAAEVQLSGVRSGSEEVIVESAAIEVGVGSGVTSASTTHVGSHDRAQILIQLGYNSAAAVRAVISGEGKDLVAGAVQKHRVGYPV